MRQLFQVFSFARPVGRSGKDNARQACPINVTVDPKHRLSPAGARRRLEPRRPQYLMPGAVGVQDPSPKLGQLPSHQALAACHSA